MNFNQHIKEYRKHKQITDNSLTELYDEIKCLKNTINSIRRYNLQIARDQLRIKTMLSNQKRKEVQEQIKV